MKILSVSVSGGVSVSVWQRAPKHEEEGTKV